MTADQERKQLLIFAQYPVAAPKLLTVTRLRYLGAMASDGDRMMQALSGEFHFHYINFSAGET